MTRLLSKQGFREIARALIAQRSPATGLSLDLGCGDGGYLPAFRGPVVGMDLAPPPRREWLVLRGRAEQVPLGTQTVDFLTCLQVAYYSLDLEQVVAEMYRVLKPEGRALVSVSRPAAIKRAEDPHGRYQALPSTGWLAAFRRGGFAASRLHPGCEVRLLRLQLRLGRLHSAISPYLWFELTKP